MSAKKVAAQYHQEWKERFADPEKLLNHVRFYSEKISSGDEDGWGVDTSRWAVWNLSQDEIEVFDSNVQSLIDKGLVRLKNGELFPEKKTSCESIIQALK